MTAKADFTDKINAAKDIMDAIQKNIDAMAKRKDIDYGDVGEADELLAQLAEIQEFLNG